MRPMRWIVMVALLSLSLLLVACGGNEYDAGTVEKNLRASQVGKVGGLPLGKATCPKDVTLTEGFTFECTLLIDGTPAPYTVTLTNVKADMVHFEAEPAKAIIPSASVVKYVTDNLNPSLARRLKTDVTCGEEKLFIVDPGTKIGCIVTIDGQQNQVSLVVKNTQGLVQIEK
ncbi:unannotated protein [freshwater metagenome]|uniref:Unannotated protein n=1 Tax=freshwater metagenome TaxID=449393 RepID=A0A6J7HDH6_9ZZZZ